MKDQQTELEQLFAELQLYSFFEEEFLIAMEEIHKQLRKVIISLKKGSAAMVLAELEVKRNLAIEAEGIVGKAEAFIAYAVHLDQTILDTLQTVKSMEPQYIHG